VIWNGDIVNLAFIRDFFYFIDDYRFIILIKEDQDFYIRNLLVDIFYLYKREVIYILMINTIIGDRNGRIES